MQSWKGTWRNQYGSTVRIDDDSNGVIRGVFRTVLQDSNFSGLEVAVHGMAHGDVIGFTSAARGKAGPAAVSYTGILRDGKIEMLWHTVAGHTLTAPKEGEPAEITEVGTWRAFGTSLDTFERIG
ncbi:avidin/streptavidin family protein [Bradyrhizobium sp.]|uniref:avidin/streptavidin family protein n=1 Tax=Bradyrhizobium sp. TaxID=376 RepID=UPI002D382981|nr:avidin/streptavidin family protein [Bradyrhizobium sp.]HZR72169.1 avidin/streptavidin family protein [Bradyrhizobium sp.]